MKLVVFQMGSVSNGTFGLKKESCKVRGVILFLNRTIMSFKRVDEYFLVLDGVN